MASDVGVSYPAVTAKGWHAIRAKAFASPSTKFTPAVVRSLLDLGTDASAQTNVLRGMRAFGIINDDGSLTELGTRWRVDETYAQACREILEKVYPEDLRILSDDGDTDRDRLSRWLTSAGLGPASAKNMAVTYLLIAHPSTEGAKPNSNGGAERSRSAQPTASKSAKPRKDTRVPTKNEPDAPAAVVAVTPDRVQALAPSVAINIQLQIAATDNADVYDKFFAAMKKHLFPVDGN